MIVTRGKLHAEIYNCRSNDVLEVGKIVEINSFAETGTYIFNVSSASDNAEFVGVIVDVDPFNKKEGTVLDFTCNKGIILKVSNYAAGLAVGDLVGVKDGVFTKVDNSTVTKAVARVIGVSNDKIYIQVI